ncbi:EamA family transporter RarD [Acinetobacter sp. MD2]|uniref:EamA family transporter RarD n=1 Tax=Acinetobacter sp. MD2 TaxID=2600066 RepID=UPI002D1F2EED|nr:EamA family transporter RarD [Acinetobacter sp. MD2]MEB3766367.1 EamA family transporter RarD [Acinetobacter sp. MD2]
MIKGVVCSVLASTIFGLLYFYSKLLVVFDGTQVFGWRMISLLPFLTLFMWLTRDIGLIKEIYLRIKAKPAFFLLLILSAFLSGLQLWLFLWAPINGRGMQVSLGYFLLPLVLVMVGSLFYKEKLSVFQKIAVLLAGFGVAHEIWRMGGIAWETVLVAVGYSTYFFMRRLIKTDHLGGFWWDNVLILPVAFYFVNTWTMPWSTYLAQPHLIAVIIGLGILSAIGLGSYILASRFLPMVIFGLLSYLEPILLAMASLLLGEKIHSTELLTYIPIWCAVVVLVLEGIRHLYKQYQAKRILVVNMEKFSARKEDYR